MNHSQIENGLDPERWLTDHGDVLYRFALLRVKRSATAEDLVQETLLAALRGADRFRGGSTERTWLLSILKHKISDHARQAGRERPATDVVGTDQWVEGLFDHRGRWKASPGDWGDEPGSAAEKAEFWSVFSGCLGTLPVRMRNAFTLRELDQIDSQNVCNELAVSPTNLGVILYRARLRLWRCLDDNWFGREIRR